MSANLFYLLLSSVQYVVATLSLLLIVFVIAGCRTICPMGTIKFFALTRNKTFALCIFSHIQELFSGLDNQITFIVRSTLYTFAHVFWGHVLSFYQYKNDQIKQNFTH